MDYNELQDVYDKLNIFKNTMIEWAEKFGDYLDSEGVDVTAFGTSYCSLSYIRTVEVENNSVILADSDDDAITVPWEIASIPWGSKTPKEVITWVKSAQKSYEEEQERDTARRLAAEHGFARQKIQDYLNTYPDLAQEEIFRFMSKAA